MKNECSGLHTPNYKSTCCLRHLVEMAKYADMQLSIKKYARLLLITLNHNFKNERLQYSTIKLDLFLSLIDVITKYMSHFFINNKLDYAKLLGIIAMKFFAETAFKDHPEVILREIATNNNISCIYEGKGKSMKAYYYLNKNLQYISTSSNLDNAILYNNLIRIGFQLNKREEIGKLFKVLYEALDEEKNVYKNTTMKQVIEMSMSMTMNNHNHNKVFANSAIHKESFEKYQMLSYLYFNQGIALIKYGMKREGNDVLKKGYEFSMSTLGEHHLYTQKFFIKLYAKNTQTSFYSDPEKEYSQTAAFNRPIDRRKFNNYNPNTELKKCYSVSKMSSNNYADDDRSKKLDIIMEYIKTIDKRQCQSETETSSSQPKRSASQSRQNSYENFKKVLKPLIHKCIEQNIPVDQIVIKKKDMKSMMDEFYNEYQNEFKNAPKRNSIVVKKREEIIAEDIPKKKMIDSVTKAEGAIDDTQYKKPFKIKRIFDKVCVIREPKKTLLGELIEGLTNNDDDDKLKLPTKKIDKQLVAKEIKEDNIISNSEGKQKNASLINPNNNSFNSKFTFKDQASDDGINQSNIRRNDDVDLKGLLAKESNNHNDDSLEQTDVDVSAFKITIAESIEPNDFEFKPFYRKNEAYLKTVQNFIAPQKCVKFLRNNKENPSNSFQDILSGAMKQVSNTTSSNMNKCQSFALPSTNQISIPQLNDKLNESIDLEISSQASERNLLLSTATDDLIESESSFDDYKQNFLISKTKNIIDQTAFFDKLNKISTLEKKSFCLSMLIPFQKDYYKILISYSGESSQPIIFKLYNKENPNVMLTEFTVDQSALKTIVKKIYLYHALAMNIDLHQLLTFEDLFKRIIIYHCYISQKDKDKESKFSLGITPKPNGLCCNKQIALKFLKSQCSIEILVVEHNTIRLNINDISNKDVYFQIDSICDQSSFNDILILLPNQLPKLKNEIYIPSYKLNDKHIAKNGIILLILKKTQEIIKVKSNDNDISFTTFNKESQGYIIQCKIEDCCNQISFYQLLMNSSSNNSSNSSLYNIDYWYLSRANGDDSNMTHSSKPIPLYTLNNLINCNNDCKEYTQMLKVFSKRDITITNYLLITAYYCSSTIEAMRAFEYMTRVSKVSDLLLHLNVIQITHHNKLFYAKMICYNPLTNYEYSIIFLPQCDYSIDDLLKWLKEHKKKSLKNALNDVFKEYIETEEIPMVKYLPMSILIQKCI